MPIENAYEGEDVPIRIAYTSGGTATDPDDTDGDGDPDADITIIANADGSEVVSSTAMTNTDAGEFEYVWDTSADAAGTDTYRIEITAEFDAETKIAKNSLKLQ